MTHAEEIARAVSSLIGKGCLPFRRVDVRDELSLSHDEWMSGYTAIFQGMRIDHPGGAPKVASRYKDVFERVNRGKYVLTEKGKKVILDSDKTREMYNSLWRNYWDASRAKKLKNRTWDRPKDWGILKEAEKRIWNETADNLEQFYRDMKRCGHINFFLIDNTTDYEGRANSNFYYILENQNKLYEAGNMLSAIAWSGNSQKLIELSEGLLGDRLPYVYLMTFAFVLIQTYESNLNVLRKTLTTDNLKPASGRARKPIEETGLETLFAMLRKHSEKATEYLEESIFRHKALRNAFSHGLFWYESGDIVWVENVNEPIKNRISLGKLRKIIRTQSQFSQCFLWVGGKLISERFFGI